MRGSGQTNLAQDAQRSAETKLSQSDSPQRAGEQCFELMKFFTTAGTFSANAVDL